MPYLNFKSENPIVKFFTSILAILAIGIIVYFFGILSAKFIFNWHLDTVNHAIYGRFQELTDWQLRYYQAFLTLGAFILPGIFLQWLFSDEQNPYFPINKRPSFISILLIAVGLIAVFPIIAWLANHSNDLIQPEAFHKFGKTLENAEDSYNQLSNRLLNMPDMHLLFFNIVLIGLMPAIGEEFIFRGIFQQIFREISKSKHVAVIVTAILFSLFHGQYSGFFPRILLGLLLGYGMLWTKNIWIPVIGHFVYNAFALIVSYTMQNNTNNNWLKFITNTENTEIVLILSCLITLACMFFLWKKHRLISRTVD